MKLSVAWISGLWILALVLCFTAGCTSEEELHICQDKLAEQEEKIAEQEQQILYYKRVEDGYSIAVIELVQESEKIKKQLEEAVKENEELKRQIESLRQEAQPKQ